MERGPPPASLPRTAPKTGIQTHPRPSGRGGTLGAQAGGSAEAAGPRQRQNRGHQPRESSRSRRRAARAGGDRPTLPPPKPKPCCGASDSRPELQRCTEADRKSGTRHPRASQRRQRAPPTRRDSAARPPHETALEPSRGSAASPQGPAQFRPSESSPAPGRSPSNAQFSRAIECSRSVKLLPSAPATETSFRSGITRLRRRSSPPRPGLAPELTFKGLGTQ